MGEISKNERSMHKNAESVQEIAERAATGVLICRGAIGTGYIFPDFCQRMTYFTANDRDMYCIVKAYRHIEPDSLITLYDGDYPITQYLRRGKPLYLAAYDLTTDYVHLFYLPDFRRRDEVYQTTGGHFRGIYAEDKTANKWKLIITK